MFYFNLFNTKHISKEPPGGKCLLSASTQAMKETLPTTLLSLLNWPIEVVFPTILLDTS